MRSAAAYKDKGRDSNAEWNIIPFTAVPCCRIPVLISTVWQLLEMFIFLPTSQTNPVALYGNLNLDISFFYDAISTDCNFHTLLQ